MALNAPSSATCGLCSELYVDPRMLQCLHSFCSKCLKKVLEEQGSGTKIKCPTCEKTASLPEGGVDTLPKDLRKCHEAAVAHYDSKLQGEEKVNCDRCIETSNGPAVSFCVNCCDFLCKVCSKDHKSWRKTLNHELQPVGSSEKSEFKGTKTLLKSIPVNPVNCQLHTDEVLKFYCETCSTLICRDCIVLEHASHSYNRIEKVAEREKADLLSTLETANGAKAKLDDAIAKGGKVMQQIHGKQKSVEEDIESAFKVLNEALQNRKKALLAKAAEIGLGKQTALTMQGEEFKLLSNEIAETCEMISTATQVYTPAEMLSAKGAMANKLQLLLKQYQEANLEPCRSDAMSSELDTSELVEKIASFGIVVGGSFPDKARTDLYIPRAIVGKEKKITISTHDLQGKRFPHGGERVKVAVSLMGSTDPPLTATVVDNQDGTYVASFTPQRTGEHELGITIDDMHIKGSPFTTYVRQEKNYTSLSCQMTIALSSNPYDVAVDDNGDIYVVLYNYHCIAVFNQSGSRIRTIGTAGSYGTADGQFYYPSAIAIRGNMLYVAEYSNHRVQKLTTSGNFISKFGTCGSGNSQLNGPRGICLDHDGRIFVSECGNNRISVFEPDGTFIYHISGNAADGSNHNGPWGITFDHSGNLHVSEANLNMIKVFTPEGKYITQYYSCLLYTSPSPRDATLSRMPSSA